VCVCVCIYIYIYIYTVYEVKTSLGKGSKDSSNTRQDLMSEIRKDNHL